MSNDKALNIHTYAVLQKVGEKLKLDPKKFALDVLDQCIDPDSQHAVRKDNCSGDLGGRELRTYDAAVALLRNEGRTESASRLNQLRTKLLSCNLCMTPAHTPGVVDCAGLTYDVSTHTLQGVLSILASLYKQGGYTSAAHEAVLDRLGVSVADKAPVRLESWRSFGAVLRDLNAQPTCFVPDELTTGILAKINPQEPKVRDIPEPQLPSPPRVPKWTSWLVKAEPRPKPRPNGYSETDRQAAALFLSHAPSEKTEVAPEHLVFSAALDCVAGKETELFCREGGVWKIQQHEGRHVTVPGWSWKALQSVLEPILATANLHSTISNACTEGMRQGGGPTLPLFCTTLSRMVHVWHEELHTIAPKMLIVLKRKMHPFHSKLVTISRLLRPDEQTFPLGSVLLQAIYRELKKALSTDDQQACALLLPLLNETMQPLLRAVSNYMHGLNPGVWLETEGHLKWETLPLPKFLNGIEESAASAGGTINDIKYIHPNHIVLQQLNDKPLPTVDLLGCERRRTGVNGILGAIVNRPPPVLPITKGIQLTVWGAVDTAEAIKAVRSEREARVKQAARHAEEREARHLELQQETIPKRKNIGIPEDWPGSHTYRRSQMLLREEKAKRQAEQTARALEEQMKLKKETLAAEKEKNLEEERATLLSKFTDDEIQAAKAQVEAEYKAKMDKLDQRRASPDRASSQASCMDVDEQLVDSCSELGPPPTETEETEESMRTAEDVGSAEDEAEEPEAATGAAQGSEEAVASEPAVQLEDAEMAADTNAHPQDAEDAEMAAEPGTDPKGGADGDVEMDTPGKTPSPVVGEEQSTEERSPPKRVPQGQVQTINILQWEESKPRVLKKKYRAKKVTALSVRGAREARVSVGGPKRKRAPAVDTGRASKQVCQSVVDTSFGPSHDCIASKATNELIVPAKRPRTVHDAAADLDEDYGAPQKKEVDVYARANELRKLRHTIPEPVMLKTPPKSIAERLARPMSLKTHAKEQEESFTSVGRLKALYKAVRERGEKGSEAASPASSVGPATQFASKDSKWALEVLISNWTGKPPVQPEELPVTLRGFNLPLSVAIDCTLRRAVEAQKHDIDEAIQEATLSKARLNDTLAVLHTVYLALDSFLSAEIAFLVDEAAARRATPINTKGRISLALHQMRTEVASNGRLFDPSECVKLFTVEVLDDIGTVTGGLAAKAGRNEYAEDYIHITYAPPERLRHIITDTHMQVYQRVHRLLLALRSAVRVSTGVLRKCARVRSSSQSVVALCLLRYEVQRMLQGVLTYLSDGLRAATRRLIEVLDDRKHPMHPTSVPGYRSMHTVFVEGLQRYTMLTSSFKPQYRKLRELIRIALELPSLALVSPPSMSAVQSLRMQFADTKKYIVDSLVSMLNSTDESAVSPIVLQYNIANWPRRSQWAKELLARIDPAGAVRASNLP